MDGLIALIDRPTLSDDKLLELIPGPDFPTGGEIVGIQGIRDAYLKGRGSITVRGVVSVETVQTGKTRRSQRPALIVSEFPFQVSKSGWIEKLAQLVNQGKLDGISDIRDESDRSGIRVVIELKREASPQKVLKQIYRLTALQNTFGVIMLSLVDNQPRQLSLRDTLQAFLDFREQTLTRQYQDELHKLESRLHLLSGLLKALDHLDAVIDILRHAPDGTTAKVQFQSRLDFSEEQANAILAMPMRRLTGMERDKLKAEFEDLSQRRQVLQRLLGDRHELLKSLKKELRQLKRKFADERRTRIVTADGTVKSEAVQFEEAKQQPLSVSLPLDLKPQAEPTVLEITQRGYGRRLLPKNATPIEPVSPQGELLEVTEDFPLQQIPSQTDHELLMFVRDGKVYSAPVGEIAKLNGRNDRGQPLVGLLPPAAQGDPDAIVAQFVADEVLREKQVVFLTQAGRIKRLPFAEMTNITARGLTVLKFKGDDGLHGIDVAQTGQQAIVASSGGRLLRMPVDDEQLPVLGRTAQGYQAVRLRKTETIAGLSIVDDGDELVLITQRGYCKRLPVAELRLGERGAIGTQGLRFANASDRLLAIVRAIPGAELVLELNGDRLLRLPMSSVKRQGKDGTGQRPKLIKSKDTVISSRICLPTGGE